MVFHSAAYQERIKSAFSSTFFISVGVFCTCLAVCERANIDTVSKSAAFLADGANASSRSGSRTAMNRDVKLDLLKGILCSGNLCAISFDVALALKVLNVTCGFDLNSGITWEDPRVAQWLLDPSIGETTLEELVQRWAPHLEPLLDGEGLLYTTDSPLYTQSPERGTLCTIGTYFLNRD